jgi:hypothetical protein
MVRGEDRAAFFFARDLRQELVARFAGRGLPVAVGTGEFFSSNRAPPVRPERELVFFGEVPDEALILVGLLAP